jgi:hypothetical protein
MSMNDRVTSPLITALSWGHIEVEGCGSFKDAKLYPSGARSWNWKETGTEHEPGIQFSDVEELLEHGAEVVVLSRGVHGRLKVREDTLRKLEERGIEAHVLKSKEAVKFYNQLREDKPVGGLFHSTC